MWGTIPEPATSLAVAVMGSLYVGPHDGADGSVLVQEDMERQAHPLGRGEEAAPVQARRVHTPLARGQVVGSRGSPDAAADGSRAHCAARSWQPPVLRPAHRRAAPGSEP